MAAAGTFLLAACAEPPAESPPVDSIGGGIADAPVEVVVRDPRLALFSPLPERMESAANELTLAKINLGRKLYYDPRLSKNQDVSCNTCHLLDKFGVDGLPTSVGHLQQVGTRNAPTVYNAAGHISQFWDGRVTTVEEQAKGPLLNPIEMAMEDEAAVEAVLMSIPGYAPLFAAAFPDTEDAISFNNMAQAIGAFERGLVTRSRFDDYLAGDDTVLNEVEQAGVIAFMDVGCSNCHSGPYLGGSMYQKLGLVQPWADISDLGRFDVTGKNEDMQVFKVPSLRNVSQTGPYFHDGSVGSLNEAVRLMARHQLGVELTNEQVISIIAFLNSLDGTIDDDFIMMPELPASGKVLPELEIEPVEVR
ncbi:MAG: cytochrome-c peroxidase [Gammaproteobacteria bacterium]|nr:cytochrome-c peroxidase [Gammaproteobacteria bacterium]MCP4090736.1 cytochrome-c peroxidase [Gammaproteobacteria bacterium]MCP4277163.1 cytochrome-c peroxidase [Gammaproteobacteria bacterium]MCP4831703.1 cytochrome-c peroxidase [Gammaproteobacteria bacterium]MCP4928027.1 cytochrome-c peroxidase [Gammaproteobacteria bacterium]